MTKTGTVPLEYKLLSSKTLARNINQLLVNACRKHNCYFSSILLDTNCFGPNLVVQPFLDLCVIP